MHHRARPATILALAAALVAGLLTPAAAAADAPPDAPVIVSPTSAGVSVDDVHMEIGAPFRDPDGDAHAATDWEILQAEDGKVVWAAYASKQLVHAHFSDGQFLEVVAIRTRRLAYKSAYVFRVRFQDSRGSWSAWSERPFTTSLYAELPLRQVQGVLTRPAPAWRGEGGSAIGLPVGARLTLETVGGHALLTLASAGDGLVATAGPRLGAPEVVRLVLRAPADAALRLPDSRLTLVTDEPQRLTMHLPTIDLAPGRLQALWVSETGATYFGAIEQSHPHRDHVARDAPLPWSVPPGYRLEAVGGPFQLPTSLAFVERPGADPAAPRFYVTELYGRIKVVTNDGQVVAFADDLLNFRPTPDFPGVGETGVIGVCLPPQGRDVYATMTFQAEVGQLRNKVVRIRSDDGLTAVAVEDILRIDDAGSPARSSHQIQQCSFGPDGKLYVFVADGPDPAAAQDDSTFNGKVLRLNPDGSAPTDNPYYDPARPTAPISYQWTKGQRNAFGMAWRPADGSLYMTENGPNIDRLVRVERGRNYGWIGSDDSMRTNALYVWQAGHWSPVGLAFAEGSAAGGLSAADHDSLLVASAGPVYARGPQVAGKAIQQFRLRPDGRIAGQPTLFARYVGEGRGSIVDLKLQPDGLYFTDIYQETGEDGPGAAGGKVWRLRYTGQAALTASAADGAAPLTVSFADASDLPAGGARAWDFGDGAASAEAAPSHTFSQPGRYAVTLTRADRDGAPVEGMLLITVADADGRVPEPTPSRASQDPAPAALFFPETGMVLGGGFKHFWEAHGGLAQFGYPLTGEYAVGDPTNGRQQTVQYFERARFEYHAEHAGTPFEVQLGQLGREATDGRMAETPFLPVADPGDGAWFAATGHTLRGAFRARWEATGGGAIYGLPISEPFVEISSVGQERLVQYFERARMQLDPEAANGGDQVRLTRLGVARVVQRP
jgi:glucose/arabinose dehydrogenase